MNSNLSWPCFEMYNSDKQTAFENMCRVLFKKRFLADNIILHSNPNNPGIEVEPVKQENTGKLISFQAKYFEPKIDYSQCKDGN